MVQNMETYHEGAYRCSRVGHADCCPDAPSERGPNVPGEFLIRVERLLTDDKPDQRPKVSGRAYTDALKYLPQMGLDPSRVVGCAVAKCQNSLAPAHGFAVEAIVAEKCSIVFFCSAGCYLNEIPSNCLARA